MKVTNKLKIVLLCVLSFFALVCCITGFTVTANQAKDYEFVLSGQFQTFYQVGDQLVIPAAKVSNGSKEYEASFNVVLPDKTVTKDQTLSLEKAGNYKVEYQAFIQEEQWYVTRTFDIVVNNNLYSVIGEGKVDYVNYNDNISGVVATLYEGDTFTYNDYIDLTQIGDSPLFKMMTYPQIIGEADAEKINIKIADVYNEDRFVTIRLKKSNESGYGMEDWGWICSYSDAGFTDGTYKSDYVYMQENKDGSIVSNGVKYSVGKNSEKFGKQVDISLTGGKKSAVSINSNTYGVSFNHSKNQLKGILFVGENARPHLLADFGNMDIFPQLFAGFTDGKVKVSITPEVFNKSSCRLIFTEFAGRKVIENNFNTFIYKQAPLIDIDFAGVTAETIPNGLPGEEYTVYNAKGFDYIDGEIAVEPKVYFGYSNKHKISIDIVDGKFTPKNAGVYTIEYTAKNSFGVTTVKTVDILISQKSSPFVFSVDGFISSALAGEEVRLFNNYTAENYYGFAELTAIVELVDNPQIKFELSEENGFTFTPLYSGQYNVTLLCKDYVEEVKQGTTFEVRANNKIFYTVNGYFPRYLIKNGIYTLPTVVAEDLSSGVPVVNKTELYIVKSDNSEIKCDGALTVPEDNVIKLSYKPVGAAWAQPYEITLPIVDTGLGTSKISKKDYFHTIKGGFTKTATADDVCYVVDSLEDGEAALEFVNILQGHDFFVSFAPYIAESGYKQIDSLTFTLYDVADVTKFVKLAITVKEGGLFLVVNDNKELKLSNSYGAADDVITISYDIVNGVAKINSTLDVEVVNFCGLSEGAVFANGIFAEMSIRGKETGCGVRINTLNDQILSSSTRDRNAPVVDTSFNNNSGEQDLNEVVTFYPYKVYDVLSPTVKFNFNIKKPNDEYAVALDGTVLNGQQDVTKTYQLKLDSVGDYEVYLIAEDVINGVKNTKTTYKINVLDKTLPAITLGSYAKTAKVGKAFTIATYNVDKPNCTTFVSVLNANGAYELIKDKKYTPKQKGKYVVTITAIDENGNMAHEDYIVTVK